MAAKEMVLSRPILHLPPLPNTRHAVGSLKIGHTHFQLFQEKVSHLQRLSLVSSSPRVISGNVKIYVPRASSIPTGLSSGPQEIKSFHLESMTIKLWEMCPEPVRVFPWKKACEKVSQRLFNLLVDVAKRLFIPVMVITSLMEIFYSIAQNKELLIPISMLAGCAFAEFFKETATELSQNLKEGGFPWHLLIIGSVFALIKIPGPHYPYWGRIILPHFANGGLWQTIWLAKIWYKKPSKATEVESNNGENSKSGSD
eukprot:Gb_30168 [translate_table: standard]